MATRKQLSKKSLVKPGAEALAEALLEEANRNACLKQRLFLLRASEERPDAVAKEVRICMATSDRSTAFVDWQGIKKLEQDLWLPLDAIVRQIAPVDPALALEFMWHFPKADLSRRSIFDCRDDSNDRTGDV